MLRVCDLRLAGYPGTLRDNRGPKYQGQQLVLAW